MSVTRRHRKVLHDFSEYTSAHGFLSLRRSGKTYGRVFWILAMFGCWVFGSYQVYDSIRSYMLRSTLVTVRVHTASNASFPAVTVCNLNNVRQSQCKNTSDFGDWLTTMQNRTPEADSWADEQAEYSKQPDGQLLPGINEEELLRQMLYYQIYTKRMPLATAGHQLADMMLECTFQGRQCTPKNFVAWRHALYGDCYTYALTAAEQADAPSFIGPQYGLTLTLYVQNSEYLPIVTSASGFRVQVHSPLYVPFPGDLGFTISPGQVTSVSIRHSKIDRMPLPFDGTDCGTTDKDNTVPHNLYSFWKVMVDKNYTDRVNYTNQVCKKDCYQRVMKERCGCIDASITTWEMADHHYGADNVPRACNMSAKADLDCTRNATKETLRSGSCDTQCPQECNQCLYDLQVTSSLWPRRQYYDQMANAWQMRSKTDWGNISHMDALRELVKLEIYYQELNYQEITESEAMSFMSLLSTIGGTLGLWAGMSVLTWIEFGELFVRLFISSDDDDDRESNNTQTDAK